MLLLARQCFELYRQQFFAGPRLTIFADVLASMFQGITSIGSMFIILSVGGLIMLATGAFMLVAPLVSTIIDGLR